MGKRLIGSVGLAPGSDEGTDLTTKGDIHGYSTTNTRIPIGSDTQVLTADSGEALGLKWADAGGGGGSLELLETKDVSGTSTDTLAFTFSTALDFESDTAAMFFLFKAVQMVQRT